MNSADFQADIKSFMETAGDQCADLAFIRCWTAMLHWPPDMSATAPQTDSIKATKGNLRWAERLTMHTKIYTKQWGVVKTLVRAAGKLHFSARIENCSNTKQLFSVSNGLLGESKTTPIPSEILRSALPDRFYMFFSKENPEHTTRPWCSPFWTSSILYDGPKLCLSKPVTEEEIRKLIVELPTKTCMLDHIPTPLTKEFLFDLLPLIKEL